MLSPKELELVNNADWILTKNTIINKVYQLFGQLSERYLTAIQQTILLDRDDLGIRTPKISKGEQYEGLPWVMLDYPRNFTGEDAFGIRSFFWWGNCCSITLQLAGRFQQKYVPMLEKHFADPLKSKEWFISTATDPWQHHFRNDNYEPVNESKKGNMSALPFIKLAKKIPLDDWSALDIFFEKNYTEILQILTGC